MVLARIDALDEREARDAAGVLARAARAIVRTWPVAEAATLDVRGPAAAPIARIRNRYRFRVMMRSSSRERLRQAALAVHVAAADLPRSVRVAIDVDPVGAL